MVVFGIKNDGNHRQSATTVNSILCIRVIFIYCIRVTHALDIILFTFRYLLASFFKMSKTTLLFYICLQTFVAQKLSKGHHSEGGCGWRNYLNVNSCFSLSSHRHPERRFPPNLRRIRPQAHHRQTLCETSNNQPIARLLLKVFPMSIVFLRLRYKHDEARIGRKDTIDLFRSL